MTEDIDNTVLGLEEGRLWLPSHVLSETCDPKDFSRPRQHRRFPVSLIDEPVPEYEQWLPRPGWRSSRHRPRSPVSRASGGPGMQAIFLSSGEKSCGTGFFLPRRVGDDFQPIKKPGCSPVLLPSRVVQALNLNVHALGTQLTPQREMAENNLKKANRNLRNSIDDDLINNAEGDEVLEKNVWPQSCVIPKSRSSSPEIFLPKEWSY